MGLIASDGCLQKDGRHIDLTSVDIEQLENFRLALGREVNITAKGTDHKVPAYRIQFSDVALYDFLVQAGLMPAKSHILGEIYVPDEYYFDFLRGVFDGDGCVRGFKDIRWPNSHMFYVEFASASPTFIQFLQHNNSRLAQTTKGSIHPGRALTLSYAKKDSIKLAIAMYYAEGIPALTRKRVKLFDFIKAHEAAIMARNARVVKW